MFSIIGSDLRRALLSRGFLIGALAMVVVIACASVESLLKAFGHGFPLQAGYHAQLIMGALHSDTILLAVPILCTLPFTPVFVDDIQSGFIKQFLPRTGVNAYIRSKLIACALSGGLVLFIGVLLAYIVATLIFLPMEGTFSGATIFTPIARLLPMAGMFFCSGMLWSLVGFTLASVTKSRYMAYAAPFIFFYILIIIYERYFGTVYYLYPKEWLNPTHVWVLGIWGLILFLAVVVLGISMVFIVFARGKLSNG